MAWFSSEIGATDVVTSFEELTDVNITNASEGDVPVYDGTNDEWVNQPKSLYPSAPTMTWAEYQQLVDDDEDDPDAEYYIDDIDVAEAYYVETSGQTALTGATSLTFTNSHIKPTSDIRILAEPASCKVATNPQYKVSAKLSSVGSGTATITFPALAENTTFWLLIECPLAVTVDPAYVYNTDETVVGTWIDGKPIYRVVIPITSPTSGLQQSLSGYSISKVVRYEVFTSRTSSIGSQIICGNFIDPNDSIHNFITNVITTASWHCNFVYSGGTIESTTLILEYTKTTD